jgi:hypothetical protein
MWLDCPLAFTEPAYIGTDMGKDEEMEDVIFGDFRACNHGRGEM